MHASQAFQLMPRHAAHRTGLSSRATAGHASSTSATPLAAPAANYAVAHAVPESGTDRTRDASRDARCRLDG